MRIIKAGILPENKVITATCMYCKCVFEFSVKEAKHVSDQRDGDYYQIDCPTCSRTLSVNPNWTDANARCLGS